MTTAERAKLVEEFYGLAWAIGRAHWYRGRRAGLEAEDVSQEAHAALAEAAAGWDPERDGTFPLFAGALIRRRVRQAVRAARREVLARGGADLGHVADRAGDELDPRTLLIWEALDLADHLSRRVAILRRGLDGRRPRTWLALHLGCRKSRISRDVYGPCAPPYR
jgi:DNA-directed RNA polymerase specialized sigma subunit